MNATAEHAGSRDLDSRGRTVIDRKVLEKIASQVASEESFAGGSSGGFLGIGAQSDFSARPKVAVELSGNIAALSVEIGLLYPVPLRQVTDQLRRRISERVTALTGVDVRQIDITVSWLKPAGESTGRRRLL
ncbi:Asp23/Gls24 family envelope stress response protein [Arthrobacter sp. B6]|uniref:Asp23/Gls24 family envelope stress response protein n=1 Tax=Arthrobacter sp. B6 TaxID=1570137 RepID=UPI00082E86D2|nr:Asp23/Gls24 family envelope stress response protein [Arthrobacter sp. B6]